MSAIAATIYAFRSLPGSEMRGDFIVFAGTKRFVAERKNYMRFETHVRGIYKYTGNTIEDRAQSYV